MCVCVCVCVWADHAVVVGPVDPTVVPCVGMCKHQDVLHERQGGAVAVIMGTNNRREKHSVLNQQGYERPLTHLSKPGVFNWFCPRDHHSD